MIRSAPAVAPHTLGVIPTATVSVLLVESKAIEDTARLDEGPGGISCFASTPVGATISLPRHSGNTLFLPLESAIRVSAEMTFVSCSDLAVHQSLIRRETSLNV